MTTIQIDGVSKTYVARPPVEALRDVTMTITSGEIVAVLGPSGCGKTTLLRIIAGFERPDKGTVLFDGVPMAGPSQMVNPERRGVGIVPQEGGLFPHLDVAANIAFGLRNLPRPARQQRVDELLTLVDLAGLGSRRPDELSGGQQQRVALARALARRPGIVLLDEPFAALDTGLRASLRDEVGAVLRATGTTAMMVTHDQGEALTTADRVAVMRGGRIIQCGAPQHVYQQPADLAAAKFLGDCTVLGGVVDGDVVETAFGRLDFIDHRTDASTKDVAVMIRPEQIVGAPDGVQGSVRGVRFEGAVNQLTIEIDDHICVARWPATQPASVGDIVAVAISGPANIYPA